MKNLKVSLAVFLSSFLISFTCIVYFWTLPLSTATVYIVELANPLKSSLREREYYYEDLTKADRQQVDCLATNMYHEAKNQGYYGMKAVGLVTMNRAGHRNFPPTVCEVVYQKKANVCQFSWYCSRKALALDTSSQEYRLARSIAVRLYAQRHQVLDFTGGALFFHADYVNPRWNKTMIKTVQIGRHIFYTL
jgi:spore germination cell wall hydrolase CwlJ-like protein